MAASGRRGAGHRPAIAMALAAGSFLIAAGGTPGRAADPGYLPDERSYAVFDAVFLQRDNAAKERPLVVHAEQAESA